MPDPGLLDQPADGQAVGGGDAEADPNAATDKLRAVAPSSLPRQASPRRGTPRAPPAYPPSHCPAAVETPSPARGLRSHPHSLLCITNPAYARADGQAAAAFLS